jgi:hypothetical protein
VKKLTTQDFINKAETIHGIRYDYSGVDYINANTLVTIVCKDHGNFQIKPTDHLSKHMGCTLCPGRYKRSNKDNFIQKAMLVHGDKYDYSLVEYTNTHHKVTIGCPIHGTFNMSPVKHISAKQGCHECGLIESGNKRRTTIAEFIEKSCVVHGDKYNYSKVQYYNNSTKVEILCKTHGSFFQTPDAHINKKHGCMKCFNETTRGGLGGYTEGWFKLHPERVNMPALLYVVEMVCGTDNFIKVGITINTIKQRFSRSKAGDKYIKKQVLITKQLPLIDAYRLEQTILSSLNDFKYFPNYVFDGRTECLKNNTTVLTNIQNIIKEST